MAKIIKIAIDISPTQDGNAVRGVGYYTSNLVSALQSEIKTNPNYKKYQIDLITNINDLRSNTYDLIHYPYFDPFKLTLPKRTNIPTIVTVHDLIPRQFKSHFPVGIKGEIKWLIQKNHLQKVNKILTVSNYSKNVIKNLINYDEKNIFVTYESANDNFKPCTNSKKLDQIRKKYNLPQKFVLFIGDINWNKNIPTLVKACLKLNYPLVIVGSAATKKNIPNHPWTQDICWLQTQHSSNLILTGFVPDEDLPYFYNLATIYCQPSFAEGFGLPLVEAMKSACPVIYSQDSCLDEIMDSNGLSFNPSSQKDLEKKLSQFWNDNDLRQKYIKMALNHVKKFDWKYTAIQTLALYNLILKDEK